MLKQHNQEAHLCILEKIYVVQGKNGLSQEVIAEPPGASRQTISQWELNKTLPDIFQKKCLSLIYHVSLDEFTQGTEDDECALFSIPEKADELLYRNTDRTRIWSKKYPGLASYPQTVHIARYAYALRQLLET